MTDSPATHVTLKFNMPSALLFAAADGGAVARALARNHAVAHATRTAHEFVEQFIAAVIAQREEDARQRIKGT